MGRKILFITTDQMRYDALGCNSGEVARTPVIDGLARAGINYRRAHGQSVVCMPARATMITGQYVRSHGVWMNGVPLPVETPNVAQWLKDRGGYATALVGKAHFEPWLGAPEQFYENRMATLGEHGPYRGFDHMALANHYMFGHAHYDVWMRRHHPEWIDGFYQLPGQRGQNTAGGGDTHAIQVWHNPVPRDYYHTDWVADRTIDWLKSLDDERDWFVWMSFPDPHHPWDPPASELARLDWRNVPLPAGFPSDRTEAYALLSVKPKHWLGYYTGDIWSCLESPRDFAPADLTADQVREINAMIHVENELIDEACGRVLRYLEARGWGDHTDVIFTTDHGELQGDFGLLFKGPYHVDGLLRLPFVWRPAPAAGIAAAEVTSPVGQVDLAQTFCHIAGVAEPPWAQGQRLPTSEHDAQEQRRCRVITEWESEHGPISISLRTLYRDGYLCTVYEPGSLYSGSEGELYATTEDPQQRVNLWHDPGYAGVRSDLRADLYDNLPAPRAQRLARVAPV